MAGKHLLGERVKRAVATAIRRGFLTLVALLMALTGAAGIVPAVAAVSLGLVLDLVRNLRAPDLRRPARVWAASVREAAGDETSAARHRALYRRRVLPPLVLAWGYVLFWVFAEPALPQGLKNAVFVAFSPLSDLAGGIFGIQRRHAEGLAGLGLPDRAALTAHLYSVVLVLLAVRLWLQTGGAAFHGAHALARREATVSYRDEEQKLRQLKSSWRYGVTFLAMGSIFYTAVTGIIELRGEEFSRYDWNIQESNLPFLIFTALYASAFYAIGQAYCYFILYEAKREGPGDPFDPVPAQDQARGGE